MAKTYPKLGATLKKLLFDKNMKPSDLAREVNLPPPTIHRLVTGKSNRPYQSSLAPIAAFFNITVEELTGEAEPTQHNKADHIPIITWQQLALYFKENFTPQDYLPYANATDTILCVTLNDSSMEPAFITGSSLIFNTEITAKDRSYVLAHIQKSNVYLFRQLIINGDMQYLKALNPDLTTFPMRELTPDDTLVAVLVESRFVHLP